MVKSIPSGFLPKRDDRDRQWKHDPVDINTWRLRWIGFVAATVFVMNAVSFQETLPGGSQP